MEKRAKTSKLMYANSTAAQAVILVVPEAAEVVLRVPPDSLEAVPGRGAQHGGVRQVGVGEEPGDGAHPGVSADLLGAEVRKEVSHG